jgi:hypothetical protein
MLLFVESPVVVIYVRKGCCVTVAFVLNMSKRGCSMDFLQVFLLVVSGIGALLSILSVVLPFLLKRRKKF